VAIPSLAKQVDQQVKFFRRTARSCCSI